MHLPLVVLEGDDVLDATFDEDAVLAGLGLGMSCNQRKINCY